ncbi:2-C-methyl-D-erythritol 4-phosphate cytidylyltransferase [Fulvivirgaceae bacterium BMA10]|uniref:2-C-methyl-D-erythritol 4-phosphate cytidylyltransferase n=1 Tax=Splendidivirga corallicola TaxID=3051826 RepID=A0ABT8KL65_9BACT|nr:2-C-methyl-D-erythritol 4-phosphate cytidylyltransferase [Fulvivirgaceae bacterium BMA10]
MKAKEYAIIVAGGSGTRMNSQIPKQFLVLADLPVLMHTINAFDTYSENLPIILVLPKKDIPVWEKLCIEYNFTRPLKIVAGGASRFQSVKNGLSHIEDKGLVAIHDGVRPIVSKDIIANSFKVAAARQSAVAAVKLKESIRVQENGSHTKALDRSRFHLIQTPQTFDIALLKEAYQVTEQPVFTDDASVVEYAGHKITLFEGSYKNLKITTPEDLLVAEVFLKNQNV